MTEDVPTVASAIVIPESADPSPPTQSPPGAEVSSLKRRQSDTSNAESKRRRLSTDDSAPPTIAAPESRQDERRKSRQLEERKRGQRLFGTLLGTLSQGSSNAAQKRRADIEKRQQAKLKQRDEEDSQRRRDRLEKLKVIRRGEQKKHNEKTMRVRHANLLHFANFLQTKAEPRLYFKPWEPTSGQADQIRRQVEEAQETINREREAFEQRRAQEQAEESKIDQPHEQNAQSAESDKVGAGLTQEAAEPISDNTDNATNLAIPPDDTISAQTQGDDSSATAVNESVEEDMKDVADDEQGETVVEADEDTVIY